jgi:protein-S-isoprenylcysteine O-methyltransferase Ste14
VIVAHIRKEKIWESRIKGEITQEERGNRSFWLIAIAMMAVFYLSPLEYLFIESFLPHTNWMEYSGVALVVSGCALFLWTRRTLGLNYSGQVAAKHGQILIKHGPFRYIRHPAYAGYLLMALGISIGYASLLGMTAWLVALLPGVFYRMHVEEKILCQHFGEAYQKYADVTKRLIPGLL